MLEQLADLVNGDTALVRRGQHFTGAFLVEARPRVWLVHVLRGRIDKVETGPLVMPSWRFALRADEVSWQRFWRPRPAPGDHDLLALVRRGLMKFEGDLQPLMANLLYIKGVLETLRAAQVTNGATR
ncbi:hypothetical protein [Reyranella sp.]|uniref:hypothetical protein n=1 Tax=Reyranella sp. TaxID=1929291 RepID=UPI003D0CB52B